MPITEGKYKCLICEDEFDATSGSYTKCECGESEIEPSMFGYSYKNSNKVKTLNQETYYLEEEFVKLDDECQKLLAKIKEITDGDYCFSYYDGYENGRNDEKFLNYVHMSYSSSTSDYSAEYNYLKLNIELKKERQYKDDSIESRLRKFLDYLEKMKSGELDFKSRTGMIDLAEKDDLEYRAEQLEEYDYKFYI